jgi:hypothetical protein
VAEPYRTEFAHPPNQAHCRAWLVPSAALQAGQNEIGIALTSGPRVEFVFVDLSLP